MGSTAMGGSFLLKSACAVVTVGGSSCTGFGTGESARRFRLTDLIKLDTVTVFLGGTGDEVFVTGGSLSTCMTGSGCDSSCGKMGSGSGSGSGVGSG